MKNIRKFETVADYEAWMSGDVVYPNVCYVAEDGRIAYNPPPPEPLYVEALQQVVIRFGNNYEYSMDNRTWTSGTKSTSISAKKGEKVYLRASGLTANSSRGIGGLSVSKTPQNTGGKFNIGGNIMSMVYGADFDGKTEITQDYQFYHFF